MTAKHWGHTATGDQITLGRDPHPGDCFRDVNNRILIFVAVDPLTSMYECKARSDGVTHYCQPEYLIWLPEMHYGAEETKC